MLRLFQELKNLTGKQTYEKEPFYWISNDINLGKTTLEAIRETQPRKEQEIYWTIGHGATISLAPELSTHFRFAIVFDSNSKVLKHNALLIESIASSSSPQEALKSLASRTNRSVHEVRTFYSHEAENFGPSLHWTSPERFPLVREALRNWPVLHLAGNFLDTETISTILTLLAKYGFSTGLLNLTNIHYAFWLERNEGEVSFLHASASLFCESTLVTYSYSPTVGEYPIARWGNIKDYIDFLKQLKPHNP